MVAGSILPVFTTLHTCCMYFCHFLVFRACLYVYVVQFVRQVSLVPFRFTLWKQEPGLRTSFFVSCCGDGRWTRFLPCALSSPAALDFCAFTPTRAAASLPFVPASSPTVKRKIPCHELACRCDSGRRPVGVNMITGSSPMGPP